MLINTISNRQTVPCAYWSTIAQRAYMVYDVGRPTVLRSLWSSQWWNGVIPTSRGCGDVWQELRMCKSFDLTWKAVKFWQPRLKALCQVLVVCAVNTIASVDAHTHSIRESSCVFFSPFCCIEREHFAKIQFRLLSTIDHECLWVHGQSGPFELDCCRIRFSSVVRPADLWQCYGGHCRWLCFCRTTNSNELARAVVARQSNVLCWMSIVKRAWGSIWCTACWRAAKQSLVEEPCPRWSDFASEWIDRFDDIFIKQALQKHLQVRRKNKWKISLGVFVPTFFDLRPRFLNLSQ